MYDFVNLSDAAANAQATTIGTLMNSGKIELYSGPQPVSANAALSGNTLLATLTFSATAFGAASGGTITANAIASGTAGATGTATFARIYESNGTSVVGDITVGVTGAGLNLTTTAIVAGASVGISAFVWTVTET